jgi:hypothetical protein
MHDNIYIYVPIVSKKLCQFAAKILLHDMELIFEQYPFVHENIQPLITCLCYASVVLANGYKTGCPLCVILTYQPMGMLMNDHTEMTNVSFFICIISFLLTYLLTSRAEPFFRSYQMCSHSRTSHNFMEPEGSSPCSQEPSTGPYPEPDRSSP